VLNGFSAELLDVDPSVWSHRINLDRFDVYWNENVRFAELVRKRDDSVDEKHDSSLFGF
jgi:hypothetical protein